MDGILYQSVLVLNAGMIPIDICTVRKAILDILREIAVPINLSRQVIRSPSISLPVPSVIAHINYNRIPRRDISLSKFNIMQRDDQTCAYCRKRFPLSELTIDHIIPRSRWKKTMGDKPTYAFNSWENMVTACNKCNFQKGNRLLNELGWKLSRPPARPAWLPQLFISRQRAEKMGWLDYCGFNVKLMETPVSPSLRN